ncbi:uncharacterized protein LOC133202708 [Saccostrea echinata]|uniref:uncharacterized protein LOC133202708 n=1 Tax=Saccostrea echinata TaxID=191078 RepID=UPI002A8375F6|nr:uncharacterized protein LOC133202708 [Saccostrea echinata]
MNAILAVTIWDRASLVCKNVDGKQIIDQDSYRSLYVDSACSSGEIEWRMTRTIVALHFRRPSAFAVCFSSKALVGYEKFSVYNISFNNMFVGSPNIETEVCLNSVGNVLDVNLLSLRKYFITKAYFRVRCIS